MTATRSTAAEEGPAFHLAYVFERFPSFTQTFCAREILELERQGIRPLLFSIRDTRRELPRNFPEELYQRVVYLPTGKVLAEQVKSLVAEKKISGKIARTLNGWANRPDSSDKQRIYEAAWIGLRMQEARLSHAHAHFAGLAARTCWWLQYFFGYSYSFTGHANDLFCEKNYPVKLQTLVDDSTLIISVSDYAVDYLTSRFPNVGSKIKRVYNGLDLEPFQTAASTRDPEAVWSGARLVLSIGRLIEKKGFDDLIDACALLSARGVKDVRCAVVGDGPMRRSLLQKAEDLNVRNIDFVGAKSQTEILELMRRAAFFVLPCVTETDGGKDNLPTVIMEAMAARLACLSTKVAGVPEMIVDGLTGRLVPERRPDLLADAMMWLLANPRSTEAMGVEALARAQVMFSPEATVKHLRTLFAERGLLAEKASPVCGQCDRVPRAGKVQAGRLKRYLQPRNWRNPRGRS